MRQKLVPERHLPPDSPFFLPVMRARFRLLCCLLLQVACATTPQTGPKGPVVDDLRVEGTDQLSDSEIKKRILTTENPWWEPFWPFAQPERFDPNAWQADLRRIERFYQSEGFYQAQVLSPSVTPVKKDAVAVQVTVKEGQPTKMGQIKLEGFDALPPGQREKVLKALPLEQGAIFRENDWNGVKEELQGRLRELGYAEAEVKGEVEVDVATQQATARLQAEIGPRYRFGKIFVAADAKAKVSAKRVAEQARASVIEGRWYSETALAEAQARVFRMGVFGAVKVNRGAPDRDRAIIPIVVDVREAPFHQVRLGGGVGVDAFRQEGRLLAEYTDRNFLGGLRRLTLEARVGYAFIPSVYAVVSDRISDSPQSAPIFDLSVEFEQPRLRYRDLKLQTSLSLEKGLQQAYDFIGGAYKGGVIWQPHSSFSIYPSYNLEVYRLTGQVLANSTSPSLTFGCRERGEVNGLCNIALSYLEQTIEWDRRNDAVEPKRGFFAAISFQEGGGPLLGSFSYLRVLPDLRYYQSFGSEQRLTFGAKLRMGTLIPFSDSNGQKVSPIVSRFYSGGSFMRGFNSRRLSPLVAVPVEHPTGEQAGILAPVGQLQGTTVPVGGDGLLETSVELRYRMAGQLVGAAFYDTGFVSVESFPLQNLGRVAENLQHAVGVGLRYLTVIGPIRLDVARRLNVGPPLVIDPPTGFNYPIDNTCFGLGKGRGRGYSGSPEGLCTFHLSIGEAF